MKTNEHDLTQEMSKDPRVLEVFNALRANPKITLNEVLFDYAVVVVEYIDIQEMLTEAKKQNNALELNLAAISGNNKNDILKSVFNENDLKSRVNEEEGRIKGVFPELTICEATNGWAMMTIHLRDAFTLLKEVRCSNAELANQLAAAQRGILTGHDVTSVITNNDPYFQYSATNPRIKFLAEEFTKIPGMTLNMAVDRWATFSLGVAELRLELERFKEDLTKKRFAANANADAAMDLHGKKVVRFKTDSTKGIKGVAGKIKRTIEVKEAVFKWCDENRKKYPRWFAINIAESLLVDEPVMKERKKAKLASFVKEWEKENNFQRR